MEALFNEHLALARRLRGLATFVQNDIPFGELTPEEQQQVRAELALYRQESDQLRQDLSALVYRTTVHVNNQLTLTNSAAPES